MLTKKNVIIGVIAVALIGTTIAAAMTVDKFGYYDPPDVLTLNWYDYFRDAIHSGPSSNNAVTEWPRWSAEYPYRTVLIGARENKSELHDYTATAYVIWSKEASLNGFRFQYLETRGNYGSIRLLVDKDMYNQASIENKYRITYTSAGDMSPYNLVLGDMSYYSTYMIAGNTIGSDVYLDFDFYYQCTDKHQRNTSLLSINGLRNVSAPYAYILTCADHGSSGGSQSGSSDDGSSGGGSSSGGSSGGGGWHEDWPDKWPNGSGSSSSNKPYDPNIDDSKDYNNNPNKDKYPWEDDKNTPDLSDSFSSSSHPRGIEEDTGERGGTWTLPEWSAPDGLPFDDSDLNIPKMPDMDFPDAPDMPETDFPELEYVPDNVGGWPPPFPY